METKLINLFAGPGTGKTTIACGLTYELKRRHITVDNPYEFPKTLVWDETIGAIKDQFFITANQHRNIVRSYGKVEYVICDSPILFGLIYKGKYKNPSDFTSGLYGDEFDEFIISLFKKYNNMNFFLDRNINSPYNEQERFQKLDESISIDNEIKDMLIKNGIEFTSIPITDYSVNQIINKIL